MAVMKERVDDRGIITRYHKIGNVSVRSNLINFVLESYPSKEYRETAQPASVYNYYFEITLEEEESMGIRQLCYTKLKTLDEWADATDC